MDQQALLIVVLGVVAVATTVQAVALVTALPRSAWPARGELEP